MPLIQEVSLLIVLRTTHIRVSENGNAVQFVMARAPVMPVRELVRSVVTDVKLVKVAANAALVRATVAIISKISDATLQRAYCSRTL